MSIGRKDSWSKTTCLIDISESNVNSTAATIGDGITDILIEFPTTTSSTFKVQIGMDGTNYYDLWALCGDSVNPKQVITAATVGDFTLALSPNMVAAPKYLKIIAGSAQAADRTFTIYYR